MQQLRLDINNAFKISGFMLRKEANMYVAEQLTFLPPDDRQEMLDQVIAYLLKQRISHPVIEKELIELAYKECSTSGLEQTETVLNVIDAFSVPKLCYDNDKKRYYIDTVTNKSLFPDQKWKAKFLLDRYTMVWQRTVRNKLFAKTALPSCDSDQCFNLQKIEVLLSSSSRLNEVVVLGLLSQLVEGKYFLEDPTGSIEIDLTRTKYHSGLFTEFSYVLAEGYYEDKIFHVKGLVLPPPESRATSLTYFGNMNTFGGSSKTLLKNSKALLQVEQEHKDDMIIFLADVWLDKEKILNKLKTLFAGYNDYPPVAIVLMGDFLSRPYGQEHCLQLKRALNTLADIINQFSRLKETCKFIFVPGRSDPCSGNILPRQALPNSVTQEIRDKLQDIVIFTTNPCRIQYCTQELVVTRQDLMMKMCRNTIHFPESGDVPDHLVKTLFSQCTLCPLPLGVQPVLWKHTDALSLYPMPDMVVIADHFQPYSRVYQNCRIINPGSFPRTEFSFKVYVPATRTVEDSQIPKEDS
ncbi:hypothetical protein O3G_MSEX002868 [Manduca sexta]|uniref:DNA polymerase epsilon subunit n=1 Tax=Manduca sexta TaxID=7130 RepID=A0A921YQ06_MANSE|nr:hypothetical protein O3G_MSEX002868 [Manduca sexta]